MASSNATFNFMFFTAATLSPYEATFSVRAKNPISRKVCTDCLLIDMCYSRMTVRPSSDLFLLSVTIKAVMHQMYVVIFDHEKQKQRPYT